MSDPGSVPSITVVTPCLNAAETLAQTLASVRAQGYPALEHVVVDGGSTDGTLEMLERAEGVRWISEPDRGLSDAFNKGVRLAEGEVVGWLNADDFYEPGALASVGRAFANSPERIWVAGVCRIVDAQGEEIRRPVTAYKRFLLRRYSFPLLLTQNFVMSPATFVRRDALGEVPLDEAYRYSADYDLWLRLAEREKPVVLDEVLSAFRMAEGSLSMSGFEEQFAEHAQNARAHANGHRLPIAVNAVLSRAIPLVYRGMRAVRAKVA
jgi:glycosyltransferase involved in cell wall biosynthesis